MSDVRTETPPRLTSHGDRGADVVDMQRYLLRWGGEPGVIIAATSLRDDGEYDGIHGDDTDRAIAAWHRERGFADFQDVSPPDNRSLRHVNGIDVSHWQDPALMSWDLLCSDYAFCIARACYGTSADRHFGRHIALARDHGAKVGAYMFFRQGQSVDAQLAAFQSQLDAARFTSGDVVPAIDLEQNDSGADGVVDPVAHDVKGQRLAELLSTEYGDCLVYMSPSHYVRIGKPQWLQHYSVWVAHYTAAAEPAWRDPWPEWSVWQKSGSHRHTGFMGGDGDLDLNYARRLPLIG